MMNARIPIFLFLLNFACSSGNAQNHWLQEGQQWKVLIQDGWMPEVIANHTVQGDTVIAGISCKIIQGSPGLVFPAFPRFAYADGNKVYVYHDQIGQFQKIYDFDAQAGDTLTFQGYFIGPVHYIIDSIGVVSINGFERTVQHGHISVFSDLEYPTDPFQIIEGVGMTRPPHPDNPSFIHCAYFFMDAYLCLSPSDGRDTKLLCYEDSEISLAFYDDCDFVSNAGDLENDGHIFRVTLFPNPVEDLLNLRFHDSTGSYLCIIRDHAGRVVAMQKISGNAGSISTAGWASGMYSIEARDESNKYGYQRFIVLN